MAQTITYHILDENGIWTGESRTLSEYSIVPFPSTVVPLPENPEGKILRFVGGWQLLDSFTPTEPEAPAEQIVPKIVITDITDLTGRLPQNEFSVVNTTVGKRLSFRAELRHPTLGVIIPVTDAFRMPIRSRDGREEVVLATCEAGIISFSIEFTESRVWSVTRDIINMDLPVESHMDFDGITVFVMKE